MDAAHWPQEIGLLKPVSCSSSSYSSPPSSSSSSMAELIMVPPPPPPPPPSSMASSTITRTPQLIERRTRPSKEQALHCPRCSSTNTKFCYYNNYSLTQPRYFCKTCRRYWTEGGSLRNVPVGGGSRKNKKSTTTTATAAPPPPPPPSSSSANVKRLPGLPPDELNPNFQEVKDYSLSFYGNDSMSNNPFAPPPQEAAAGSVLYPSGAGLGLPSFLSSAINHPMNTATMQEGGGGDGRLILPFQDFTQVHPAFEQDRGQGSNASSGLWNGVMGGGPPW